MSERTDYRDTVFLPTTSFPMRGELPKREPELLARWRQIELFKRLREQSHGRQKFILHDGPPYANGHLHIGTALNKILKDVVNRARQMAGYDADYIPGWDCHGLPIEWRVEEEYRKSGRDKDAVPVLQFRAECRAYAQRWMGVQSLEFQRLGVLGDWEHRYATMDFASEAAIANEIGKFLLNGALYRGLRPVMWSPVEKTALAEAEIEYHDHTSQTIFVRFPVIRAADRDLVGASVAIWTTTPWTIPGNRAIACGPDIDYAVVRVDQVEKDSRARHGETLLVALALLPQVCAASGIATHHVLRIEKGADLVGMICAHPLRGRGYEFDVPMLSGGHVTTEAGTGFVHIAPGHGEEDFAVGQAHGLDVPDTVGPDGTFNAWVSLFAGVHVYKAADAGQRRAGCGKDAAGARADRAFLPAFLALEGAADLPRHAAMVHPHGRAGANPRPRIAGDRGDRFRAGCRPQPHRRDGGGAAGLVRQPPARLGRADRGVRASRHRRAAARSRCRAAHRCRVPRRGRGCLVRLAAGTLPRPRPRSRPTTSRCATSSMCGSRAARPTLSFSRIAACPGRRICISKAPTSIAAGSIPRCWSRWGRAGVRRSGRC